MDNGSKIHLSSDGEIDWARYSDASDMPQSVRTRWYETGRPALKPKTPEPQVKPDDWNQWFEKNFDRNVSPYLEIIGDAVDELVQRELKPERESVAALERIINLQSRAIDLLRTENRKIELHMHEQLEKTKTDCRRWVDKVERLELELERLRPGAKSKLVI
jgi:hypothetical protein